MSHRTEGVDLLRFPVNGKCELGPTDTPPHPSNGDQNASEEMQILSTKHVVLRGQPWMRGGKECGPRWGTINIPRNYAAGFVAVEGYMGMHELVVLSNSVAFPSRLIPTPSDLPKSILHFLWGDHSF